MDRLLPSALTARFLLVVFLGFITTVAQTFGAVDCESINLHVPSSEIPLTDREQIELMGKVYFSEVSRLPRCEKPETVAPGGDASSGDASGGDASGGDVSGGDASSGDASSGDASSGDASSGDASGGDASGGDVSGGDASGGDASGGDASGGDASGGDASGGDASGGGRSNIPSFSVNNLQKNDVSIPIENDVVQSSAPVTDQFGEEKITEASPSGKEHESLKAVNNKAVMRKQIKEAADAETDPEIKAKLMEHYEALK